MVRLIQPVEPEGVHQNQENEYQNASLLSKPKTKGVASQMKLIQRVGKQNARSETHQSPNGQQEGHNGKILFPVAANGLRDSWISFVRNMRHVQFFGSY